MTLLSARADSLRSLAVALHPGNPSGAAAGPHKSRTPPTDNRFQLKETTRNIVPWPAATEGAVAVGDAQKPA